MVLLDYLTVRNDLSFVEPKSGQIMSPQGAELRNYLKIVK